MAKNKAALEKFKMEAANEVGVTLKQGYNGDITARQAGSVGGQMVKKMIGQALVRARISRVFAVLVHFVFVCGSADSARNENAVLIHASLFRRLVVNTRPVNRCHTSNMGTGIKNFVFAARVGFDGIFYLRVGFVAPCFGNRHIFGVENVDRKSVV